MPQVDRPHVGFVLADTSGSRARCAAVLRHLRASTTVVSVAPTASLAGSCPPVRLSPPHPGARPILRDADQPALGRVAACELTSWLARTGPDLLVVDGVPDAAVLGRLAEVPVALVRGLDAGRAGPTGASDSAAAWLAPYPAALERSDTPESQRQHTVHVGFLSRFEGRRLGRAAARRRLGIARDARHVAIFGEVTDLAGGCVAAAAAVASAWEFSILGGIGDLDLPAGGADRVHVTRNPDECFDHLAAADVVISDLRLDHMADTAAARRPLAVLTSPSDPPEAHRFAEGLEQTGAALVLDGWPDPVAWPALLAELLDQDSRLLQRLSDGRSARRAADWIDAWAVAAPAAADEPAPRAAADEPAPRAAAGQPAAATAVGAAPGSPGRSEDDALSVPA